VRQLNYLIKSIRVFNDDYILKRSQVKEIKLQFSSEKLQSLVLIKLKTFVLFMIRFTLNFLNQTPKGLIFSLIYHLYDSEIILMKPLSLILYDNDFIKSDF
jgi:hypothetical protein